MVGLPPEIQNLTSLTALSIGNNMMTSLPRELILLTKLKDLHVESAQLISPSPVIQTKGTNATLDYLRTVERASISGTLDLTHVGLEAFPPDVGVLSNLTKLKLPDNHLGALSSDIQGLASITFLDVSRNKIVTIAEEICNLTALTHLNLDRNLINVLPFEISACTRLRELITSNNPMVGPPAKVMAKPVPFILEYQRRFTEAKDTDALYLDEMDLDACPAEPNKLTNITHLSLVGNNIDNVDPYLLKGSTLTSLDLSNNPWSELQECLIGSMHRLRVVSVDNVKMQQIPAWMTSLNNVEELTFRDNQLAKLAPELAKLKHLQSLDCGGKPASRISSSAL